SRELCTMIEDLGTVRFWLWRDVSAVRVSHSLLLCRGIVAAPKNDSITREWCGITDHRPVATNTGHEEWQDKALLQQSREHRIHRVLQCTAPVSHAMILLLVHIN